MSSFFGSTNQGGEIWSMADISFGSNLTDILEKESFTLEELLVEDDLLQEIKSRNPTLLGFLSTPETLNAMVNYVTVPAAEDTGDLVYFKYPYMSCEVFCCEVPSVLHMLVEEDDGKYFTQLLSALDSTDPLNHYLAGYLEKILDMLFRQMTIPVMSYLNKRGLSMFQKFLQHVDNYSIMQIVQRLMLPHIPFSLETSDMETMTPEQRENCTCEWSFLPQTCTLLIDRMLEEGSHPDIPAHIAELLITVIQLSPPDAPFLSNLCEEKCLQPLVDHIWNPSYDAADSASEKKDLMTAQSLAVASVLDSLMSRMCEAYDPSFVPNEATDLDKSTSSSDRPRSGSHDGFSNPMLLAAARIAEGHSGDFSGVTDLAMHRQIQERVRENMNLICQHVIPILPKVGSMLRSHLIDSSAVLKAAQRAVVDAAVATAKDKMENGEEGCEDIGANLDKGEVPAPAGFIVHQSKFPIARLGHHGFRLVKLTESVVRLANSDVDAALVASGALEACIRLMFQYEMHSLLHLSVQRIAVMIIEGGEHRRAAQKNILIDAGLLENVINSFTKKDDEEEDTWNGHVHRFAHAGKPIMGHIIYISQVLVRTLHIETPEGIRETRDNLEDSMITCEEDGSNSTSHSDRQKADDIWSVVEGTAHMGNPDLPRSLPATLLRTIIEDGGCADQWDTFVDNEYKSVTEQQLSGTADSGASVYSASDAGGSPDVEDSTQLHMENALRALAGYSGFDGNLANRWPAGDADFVIINEEEDDDDEEDDYPHGWDPTRQGIVGAHDFVHSNKAAAASAMRYGATDGAVMVEDSGSGSSDDADSDDAAGWADAKTGDDPFGPSTGDIDIFATDGGNAANAGADFFAASPASSSSSPGASVGTPDNAGAGDNFFAADFGSNISSPEVSANVEDFFAQASSPASAGPTEANTSSDFFGESNSVFSFSSFPAPVGSGQSTTEAPPTPDEK